ncbi:MAG: sensor histidine kinase [Oligoflexus sp.]
MFSGRKRRWFTKLNYNEQMLTAFACIGSFLAFILTWLADYTGQSIGLMWINFVFCAALLLAVPLILVSRRYQLSAFYLLIIAFSWITISLIDIPTIKNIYLYWYSILPIAGGLLIRYTGLISGALMALLGLFGFVVNSVRMLSTDIFRSAEMFIVPVSSYVIFIFMASFLTFFFIKVNDSIIQSKTRKLDTLLKIVSHDISNPLTLIRGLSDLLLKNLKLDERSTRQLNKIYMASDTIHRILERVRHIQAIKSGILVLRQVPTSVRETIEKVYLLNESALQKKNLQWTVDLPKQDVFVMADPITFTNEVINNLVTNAIKFSPINSTLTIRANQEGSWALIVVIDQGIGIPEHMQRDVFDELKLTTRQGTDGERGTGFGLPLVKNLVEAFGGYVELESRSIESDPVKHGTSFLLHLPLAQENQQPIEGDELRYG